jgi:hypothetical protein
MEYVIGSTLGVAVFGGILTGIPVLLGEIMGTPLRKTQKISTFVVTSLLCVAMFLYERSFY